MPKFVIERHIPGIGKKSPEEIEAAAKRFRAVATQLGDEITWIVSFLTEDTMYCVFSAPNAELVRFHGLRTGFPADQISQVTEIISPATIE